MEFIEATLFTKYVYEYLTEEEYTGLQVFLANHPEMGALVPVSGGVRKIRWSIKGKGKRGGVRVIYYFKKVKKRSGYYPYTRKMKSNPFPLMYCS